MSSVRANSIVKTTGLDNVGIVSEPLGLTKGTMISVEIALTEDIPMGHKVALEDIAKGNPVIRYGQVIGYANKNILQGSWLNETNIEMPQPPALEDIPYQKTRATGLPPLTGYTFQGYRNADG